MSNPLFSIQGNKPYILKVKYQENSSIAIRDSTLQERQSNNPALKLSILKIQKEDAIKVSSLDDAVAIIVNELIKFHPKTNLSISLVDEINHKANLIASRTRRGAGNSVVVNEQALNLLSTNIVASSPTSTNINLIHVGKLNQTGIDVYLNPNSTNPIIVSYASEETLVDAGSTVFTHDNELYLYINEDRLKSYYGLIYLND